MDDYENAIAIYEEDVDLEDTFFEVSVAWLSGVEVEFKSNDPDSVDLVIDANDILVTSGWGIGVVDPNHEDQPSRPTLTDDLVMAILNRQPGPY